MLIQFDEHCETRCENMPWGHDMKTCYGHATGPCYGVMLWGHAMWSCHGVMLPMKASNDGLHPGHNFHTYIGPEHFHVRVFWGYRCFSYGFFQLWVSQL